LAQVGGTDTVTKLGHLYRFEKAVTDGGYMVLPHGSGYLIEAECRDELPGKGHLGGLIGGRWTLPMFGIVRGDEETMCAIVETWWDCDVEAEHTPGDQSSLDFNWLGSLGKLAYPRRFVLRFAKGMDYVAMAKLYRECARRQGLLRTLEEKAEETPVIRRYIDNILFRWHTWNAEDGDAALADIRRLKKMGFGVNFFYPKWAHGNYWKAFLLPEIPMPGGWKSLVELADTVYQFDCLIQFFINQRAECHAQEAPGLIKRILDNLEVKGLKCDVLYYDGYSAYSPLPEDASPSYQATRRQTYEAQNACFAETRRHGIMPGSELARFWCIADCDYFFFTDWSSDRLSNAPVRGAPAPVGTPIPLFELVFHDCYIAGFSGGGYALYSPGYDWWADRTPRLYELLFASAPAYNWLPEGYVPVRDWDSDKAKQRWAWLKRWNAYYRAIATSEMVSHRFLSPGRKQQGIEFANGVVAEFNMARNELRVEGVTGFSGEWEEPEALPSYPRE